VKLHFLTFAEGNFSMRQAGKRILREALQSGYFSSAKIENRKSIEKEDFDFWLEHKDFLTSSKSPVGFGNYLWKPYIVDKHLNSIPEDDALLYLDAGCHFNFKTQASITRFHEYIEIVDGQDSLATQLQSGAFGIDDLRERSWTSPSLVEELNVAQNNLDSNQVQAGILFLKNVEPNRSLTAEWLKYATLDRYRYLKMENWINEEGERCTSRFDQSIFSCLAKKYEITLIPDETYFYPNWSDSGSDYPIWAMRRRNGVDVENFRIRDLLERMFLLSIKIWRKLRPQTQR